LSPVLVFLQLCVYPTGILANVCEHLSYQLLRNRNELRYENIEKIGQAAATLLYVACHGFGSVFAAGPRCQLSTSPAPLLHWYAAQKQCPSESAKNLWFPSMHVQFSVVQLGPAVSLPFPANVPTNCTANLVHAVINCTVL
jgi:hypothetical protein